MSAAVVLVIALSGCSGTASDIHQPTGHAAESGGEGPGVIPMGPGPQHPYVAQGQPPANSCHYRHTGDGQPLPDLACTPGALNPDVAQANLATTICRKGGFTGEIRPPSNVTDKEKRANTLSYGYTASLHDAEYDHLVSLELGGDPNDPRNLWVEPPSPGHAVGAGPNNPKDAVETRLHTAVCAGKVTLSAAQHAIATDWTTAESTLGIARS